MQTLEGSSGSRSDNQLRRFHDRDLEVLIDDFKKYRKVRKALLKTLGCVDSNRDPLAEFSEKLAAHLLNASRAKSRVQKGFDLIGPNGEKIEVKYLTNPSASYEESFISPRSS